MEKKKAGRTRMCNCRKTKEGGRRDGGGGGRIGWGGEGG